MPALKHLPSIEILETGTLVESRRGKYTSFPSLAVDPATGKIIVAYRRANYRPQDKRPGMGAHGLEGSLFYRLWNPAIQRFEDGEQLLVEGKEYPPGLIDVNLTTIQEKLFLLFRRYPHQDAIYSRSAISIEALKTAQSHPFPSNTLFTVGAQWGRIMPVKNTPADTENRWLQMVYGQTEAMLSENSLSETPEVESILFRPCVYESTDSGNTWSFLSWITPLVPIKGACANETTLITGNNGQLIALSRTDGPWPGPLLATLSMDGGKTWERPQKTGLFGEAPMSISLSRENFSREFSSSGDALFCYRGFPADESITGGTFCIGYFQAATQSFYTLSTLDHYAGNHYDGGYGDLIGIPTRPNHFLTVYYHSDTPKRRNPSIRYQIFKLTEPVSS